MKFRLQDDQTGKWITVEGDKTPSLSDREAIFQQAGLRKQPQQKTSFGQDVAQGFQKGEKFAGNLAPLLLGLGGGLIGGRAGTLGGAAGGASGGAAGEVVKTISDPETYRQILAGRAGDVASQTAQNAATSGVGYGAGGALPGILGKVGKFAANPFNILRNLSLGSRAVPTNQLEASSLQNLIKNKFFQQAPGEVQQAARGRLSQFLENLNPLEGASTDVQLTKTPETAIRQIYEYLRPFETMGKAYARGGEPGSTAISQGTNLASRAIRSYLGENVPTTTRALNKLYSGGANLGNIAGRVTRLSPLSLPLIAGYELLKLSGRSGRE